MIYYATQFLMAVLRVPCRAHLIRVQFECENEYSGNVLIANDKHFR